MKQTIHKQKPCGMTGDSLCGKFKDGDIISFYDRPTCPKCMIKDMINRVKEVFK